jgi:hypothetical protein
LNTTRDLRKYEKKTDFVVKFSFFNAYTDVERINPAFIEPYGISGSIIRGSIGSFWDIRTVGASINPRTLGIPRVLGVPGVPVWVVDEPQQDLFSFAAVLFIGHGSRHHVLLSLSSFR